ncbi:hypothetical protein BJ166DRAFT_15552 [Pestalotiopsis sp. NC0098]|nr:hypothetical protein BJ166DRAFT_15552 [Pestalotiopsis sp. NC0098]
MCTRLQSPKASCSLFSRSALILICLSFYRACRRSLPNPTSTHLTSTYNQGHSTPNLSSCSYTISSPFPRRISRPHHLAARAHIQQITSDRTRRRIRINHQYIPAGARLYRSRAQKCPEHTRYRASPRVTPLRHRNGRPRDSEQQRQPRTGRRLSKGKGGRGRPIGRAAGQAKRQHRHQHQADQRRASCRGRGPVKATAQARVPGGGPRPGRPRHQAHGRRGCGQAGPRARSSSFLLL